MSFGSTPKQEPTATEREQLKIAQDTWQRYKQSFLPLENAVISEIRRYESPEYRDNVIGEAAAIGRRLNLPTGAGTSGQFLGKQVQSAAEGMALAGGGAAETGQQAHEQYYKGLQGMTQIGTNQRQTASQGMTRLAGIANQQERVKTLNAYKEQQENANALGSIAGLGLSYGYNKYNGIDMSNVPWSNSFIGPPAPTAAPAIGKSLMPVFNW